MNFVRPSKAYSFYGQTMSLCETCLKLVHAKITIEGDTAQGATPGVPALELEAIDFDDCAFGWYAYDIAVALYHQQDSSRFDDLQRAFVRGYRTRRALGDDVVALIPMFLLVRGMAVIGWLDQRPEIDVTRTIRSMKDRVCTQCETFEPPH